MRGVILATSTAYLIPLLLIFSVFLLVRGHNEPGGGFSGGLVAAAAYVLLSISSGVGTARRRLPVDPRTLIGLGLLIMVLAGWMAPVLTGQPFLTGLWWELDLPGTSDLSLGTPLLFDIGVYMGVAGTVLLIAYALEDEGA